MQEQLITSADCVRGELDAMIKGLQGNGYDFHSDDTRFLSPLWQAIDSHLITADVCELIGDLKGIEQAFNCVNALLDQILEQMPG